MGKGVHGSDIAGGDICDLTGQVLLELWVIARLQGFSKFTFQTLLELPCCLDRKGRDKELLNRNASLHLIQNPLHHDKGLPRTSRGRHQDIGPRTIDGIDLFCCSLLLFGRGCLLGLEGLDFFSCQKCLFDHLFKTSFIFSIQAAFTFSPRIPFWSSLVKNRA